MDVMAIERMEAFAKEVLKLSPEMQIEYFTALVRDGILTADEVEGLKQYVALYHMFTNQRYYNAVKECVTAMYFAENNQ